METAGDILRALIRKAGYWRRLPTFRTDYNLPFEVETIRSLMDGSIPMDESHLKIFVDCGFLADGSEQYNSLLHALQDDRKFRYEVKMRPRDGKLPASDETGGGQPAEGPEEKQTEQPPEEPVEPVSLDAPGEPIGRNDVDPRVSARALERELSDTNQYVTMLDLIVEDRTRLSLEREDTKYVDDSLAQFSKNWLDDYGYQIAKDMTPQNQLNARMVHLVLPILNRVALLTDHVASLHQILRGIRESFPPHSLISQFPKWSPDIEVLCPGCGRKIQRYDTMRYVRYPDRLGYFLEVIYKCDCGREELRIDEGFDSSR